MPARRVVVWCGLLSIAAGCGGGEEAEGTVLEQMLRYGWFSGTPGGAAAPWFSRCATVQPGFEALGAAHEPLLDPFCTVQHETEVFEEGGHPWIVEHYWVRRMGEPDPAVELAPWHHDDAYYCYVRVRLDPEPVPGYPESDVQRIPGTVTGTGDNCAAGFALGASVVVTWMRGSREGVFASISRDRPDDILFDGWVGLPDTVAGGLALPDHFGRAWPSVACRPSAAPSGEGPGYCQPATCRTFSPDGELPQCGWQDLRALPANPDLLDPEWVAAFPSLYDEIFPTDGE